MDRRDDDDWGNKARFEVEEGREAVEMTAISLSSNFILTFTLNM